MVEKVLQLNKEKYIFWTLASILLFSIGFYFYCVRTTIGNVVVRQNLEKEASSLTLKIGSEEFAYINQRNAVTLELAYSLGFKDSSNKIFVSRNPDTKVAFISHQMLEY